MPDNLIQVGATFNGSQLTTGVAAATSSVEDNLKGMSSVFEQQSERSSEALGGLKLAMEDAGVTVNRHVARWLAELPLVGAAFSVAFPIVAIISFADSITKAGEKLDSHAEKMDKAVHESLDLALSFDKQAESIEISNLKIKDHIAALEKKPTQNGIVIAAKEGQRAIDELIKSFQDAIQKENELLTGEEQGFFNKLLFGDSGIDGILDKVKDYQQEVDSTLTKLRLARSQGHKEDSAELQNSLNEQLQAYRGYLQSQLTTNDANRQAEIDRTKAANQKIFDSYTERFTAQQKLAASATYAKEEATAEDEINKSYLKTDQTLRSLLLLLVNVGKTQEEIAKHADLVGAEASAEKLHKLQEEYDKFQKSMNEINNEAAKKSKQLGDEALKEAIEGNTRIAQAYLKRYAEQKAAADTAIKDEIDQDKLASNNKIQLIEQDFLKGKINQQQEIAAIAQEKENELELEKLAQQKRWALWTGDVKKQAEIQKEINKIVAQANNVQTKAVTDGLRAQEQQYKQLFSQIGSAITSNALDVSKGTETIAQAFQKMYQSLIAGVADYLAKKAEKKAEEWAIDKLFKQAQTDTSISAAAAQAYAYGFADSAETGPEGLAAAPAVAAGAAAAVQAGARPIAQLAIGTNYVPMDGLAYLHKGEQVIPEGATGPGYKDGGGGITVVVNHSVQAMDAKSFDGFIDRQSNLLGNKVAKILKKKGYGGR